MEKCCSSSLSRRRKRSCLYIMNSASNACMLRRASCKLAPIKGLEAILGCRGKRQLTTKLQASRTAAIFGWECGGKQVSSPSPQGSGSVAKLFYKPPHGRLHCGIDCDIDVPSCDTMPSLQAASLKDRLPTPLSTCDQTAN